MAGSSVSTGGAGGQHDAGGTGGSSSEAAVGAALQAMCSATEEFTRCDFASVIDPDGDAHDVTDTSWPGPAIDSTAEQPQSAAFQADRHCRSPRDPYIRVS